MMEITHVWVAPATRAGSLEIRFPGLNMQQAEEQVQTWVRFEPHLGAEVDQAVYSEADGLRIVLSTPDVLSLELALFQAGWRYARDFSRAVFPPPGPAPTPTPRQDPVYRQGQRGKSLQEKRRIAARMIGEQKAEIESLKAALDGCYRVLDRAWLFGKHTCQTCTRGCRR